MIFRMRQTNVPCYAYCVAPWQVNYLYGTRECVGLLVLNCDKKNNVWNENESAVSQCCKVSFFEYFEEYSYTFSPVVYIHTDRLEHKWYQYKSGYYGLHSWYPIEGSVLGPLTIAGTFQAHRQLFYQYNLWLTLSPRQV